MLMHKVNSKMEKIVYQNEIANHLINIMYGKVCWTAFYHKRIKRTQKLETYVELISHPLLCCLFRESQLIDSNSNSSSKNNNSNGM